MAPAVAASPKLELGRVLGGTFRAIRQNWPWMLALGLPLAFAPRAFSYWLLGLQAVRAMSHPGTVWALILSELIGVAVDLVPGAIFAALVCLGLAARLHGQRPAGGVGWIPSLLAGALIGTAGEMLGFLLLVIPGFILGLAWTVFTPVLVLERKGPIDSLRTSANLTRSHRWTIAGVWLISWLIYLAIFYGAGLPARALWFAVSPAARPWIYWAEYGIGACAGMLYVLVWRTAATIIYFELVRLKSGAPAEGLAAVFD